MKKNTKKWYLLKVENGLDKEVEVTIRPERLVTSEQALTIIKSFYN